jgi:hypothetical protein
MTTGFRSLFCHPEPGPELDSGSIDFGISVLGLNHLGFKAPPCERGSLLSMSLRKQDRDQSIGNITFKRFWIVFPRGFSPDQSITREMRKTMVVRLRKVKRTIS